MSLEGRPSSEPGNPLRTAPPGYTAIQDLWADDFLIRTTPTERSSVAAGSETEVVGLQLYQILWVVAAIAVVAAMVIVLVAG